MTKQEIRNNYLKLRKEIPDLEYSRLSQHISNNFFLTVNLSLVKTIHIFLPIIEKKEPNTWLIIERLVKDFSDLRISIPKMKNENTLINFYFENKSQIKDNKWEIPEPQFGTITPLNEIDLVVVPLLAFDMNGNRIGYGKGYYDRFLKECRADCKKIGLSFFDPVKEISGINEFDIKLDAVITPHKKFHFD